MQPVFLIGLQRSGTTALRTLLSSCAYVEDMGECLKPEAAKYASNYFHFLRLDDNFKLLQPGMASRRFLKYIEHLQITADRPIGILDIKYDYLHQFNNESHEIHAPPDIFSFIESIGGKVIHITRNLVELYISQTFAIQSNVWHLPAGQAAPELRMDIDVAEMMAFVSQKLQERAEAHRYMRGCSRLLTIDYAEIFPSNRAGEQLDEIWRFLELPPQDVSSHIKKTISRPYREMIPNLEDALAALRQSPFAEALEGFGG